MRILGLTGSIAMGKSTAARMLRRMGVSVHDADAIVHELLGKGGDAVSAVGAAFPGMVRNGAVERAKLGKLVFADAAALRRLEGILHPLVGRAERRFLGRARARRREVVVLDIPLLFETGAERRCDAVMVVSAPRLVQMSRILDRPDLDRAKLAGIEARQMPDLEKRRRADWVIPTGLGRRPTWNALKRALRGLPASANGASMATMPIPVPAVADR